MRIKSISAALFIALIIPQCVFADSPDCTSSTFLKRYSKSGLVKFSSAGAMEFQLVADLHFADCGAPDCYGTKVRISMKPNREDSCQYSDAIVETENYNNCKDEMSAQDDVREENEVFVVDGAAFNMLDPKLTEIKLMNKSKTRAIVLSSNGFLYFENVTPEGRLHTWLPSDDDNEQECCWGASMAIGHFKDDEP